MKTTLLFKFILPLVFIFITLEVFPQGAEIARELDEYINSEDDFGFKPIKKGHKKTSKKHYIGGQQVEETNSVIYKAFEMHPEWKKTTVVADWTGSMYQYVGQIMRWHKQNIHKKLLQNLVLFNDGDDNLRNGAEKIIGNTGGIYYADPNDMDDFLKKVEVAVDNGGGGDSEENDVEAIIAAQKKYPKTDEIVLIADNTSIRDIELVNQIKRPVHVLLCNSGWVYDYVKLAYETGGSITTPTDDLDFSNKNEVDSQNIILDGVKYRIK